MHEIIQDIPVNDLHNMIVPYLIRLLCLCCSPFSSSKEVYPNYPLDNGNNANSIELERYVSQHCHRSASDTENREKLQARRKLFIAAIICLIFMVGEVVGKCGGIIAMYILFWCFTLIHNGKELASQCYKENHPT